MLFLNVPQKVCFWLGKQCQCMACEISEAFDKRARHVSLGNPVLRCALNAARNGSWTLYMPKLEASEDGHL